jgi:hypothetical protein
MANLKIPRIGFLLIVFGLFLSTCSTTTAHPLSNLNATDISESENIATTESTSDSLITAPAEITPTSYLPIINLQSKKFLGVYFSRYWTTAAITDMVQADAAIGKKHTSVGWFIDFEDDAFRLPVLDLPNNNLYRQLEALWQGGYISFVNLATKDATLLQIINGERDREIGYAAQFYKAWVDLGGGRKALIAPLQEMNGVWVSYGADPNTSAQFKQAYRHILDIFLQNGVTRQQVWWVFAPNGYNDAEKPERKFENYYPGDDVVDIVGFSSYNYGYCPDITEAYWRWESYPQIFEPYIARMQVMASSKPIIIAETASTAYYHDAAGKPLYDIDQMNQWLVENYNYFADRNGVIGIYYFSFPTFDGLDNCAIEINPNGQMLSGYITAASNSIYQYFSAEALDKAIR